MNVISFGKVMLFIGASNVNVFGVSVGRGFGIAILPANSVASRDNLLDALKDKEAHRD